MDESIRRTGVPRLARIDVLTAEINELATQLSATQDELAWRGNDLGRRERYLGGWFGGNRIAAQTYRHVAQATRVHRANIAEREAERERLAASIDTLLSPWLITTDNEFAWLMSAAQAADIGIDAATRMLGVLTSAAVLMERAVTINATWSSQASHVAQAYSAARRAGAAVDNARREVPSYNAAIGRHVEAPWNRLISTFPTYSAGGRVAALRDCQAAIGACAASVREVLGGLRTERERLDRACRISLRSAHRLIR